MKVIKPLTLFFAASLLLAACNTDQQQVETVETDTNAELSDTMVADEYWAKDNLDLQRVGSLLERSESPEEFEAYLNDEGGVNNLDLNGDGYVDYISVDEFEDRDEDERGLSLYTRFGADAIQELGTILFYREDPYAPGARVMLRGDERIYGDNAYYETNWLDKTLDIVSYLFSPRDSYYRSPYYYDNYPPDYAVYDVVERPVYVSRIERLYPEPVFMYTENPTIISKVKIKSHHNGKWMEKVYAKLAKPTREQALFIKNNPGRPRFSRTDAPGRSEDAASRTGVPPGRPSDEPGRSGDAPGKPSDDRGRSEDKPGRGNDGPPAKKANPPAKSDKQPGKPDNPGKGPGQDKGKKP